MGSRETSRMTNSGKQSGIRRRQQQCRERSRETSTIPVIYSLYCFASERVLVSLLVCINTQSLKPLCCEVRSLRCCCRRISCRGVFCFVWNVRIASLRRGLSFYYCSNISPAECELATIGCVIVSKRIPSMQLLSAALDFVN
jgi:hypothetical protein